MATAKTFVQPGISRSNHQAIKKYVKTSSNSTNMATVTNILLEYAINSKKIFTFPDGPKRGPRKGSKRKAAAKRKSPAKRKK